MLGGSDALTRARAEHEVWLAVERGLALNTLAAYRRDLTGYERFLRRRGITDPAAVEEATVGAFVEALRAETDEDGQVRYRASSVARALVAVRSFHGFCTAEGDAGVDPSEDVAAPRVPQGIPKALTEGEIDGLLAAVTGDDAAARRDRAILETLYGTGLRISELVGLNLADLDLTGGFLRAFGKGSKERIVPVGRAASGAIEAWLPPRNEILSRSRPKSGTNSSGRNSDANALFINPRGGRLTRQGCWKIIRRHGVAAGLGGRLSPHVLRHSCATHMVEHGADLRVVQELLGHASVSTTQVYTKVTQSRLRAVYESAHPRARLSEPPAESVSGPMSKGERQSPESAGSA